MGVVKYASGIEYVKGSLAKPTKKDGHSHGTYLIGTHREAPSQNPDCTRLYVRPAVAYKRTSAPTTNELEARNRFAEVGAMVRTRAKDLSKITTDQAAFLAQKDSANGKKTMKAYLWKVCGDEWDDQNS